MVTVNRRGFHDWLIQRASAVIIGVYTLFLIGFFLMHRPLLFSDWQSLFSHAAMKIATIIVLVAIVWHAWIGLWTVFTDYVKNTAVRMVLQTAVIALLAGYFVWCVSALY